MKLDTNSIAFLQHTSMHCAIWLALHEQLRLMGPLVVCVAYGVLCSNLASSVPHIVCGCYQNQTCISAVATLLFRSLLRGKDGIDQGCWEHASQHQ
jgi:hypothetical protein